jgi:CRP/FNR family transcriptional regulator, anaerobic regulatory protein
VIPPDALSHLLKSTPQIERALFRASSIELEARHDWTFLLRGCSSYQRLALFLWLLAMRAQPQSNSTRQNKVVTVQLSLPLSREEIAGFLDITIETVSRQMTLMKKRGIIEVQGSREVIIPNIGLLADDAAIDFAAVKKASVGLSL